MTRLYKIFFFFLSVGILCSPAGRAFAISVDVEILGEQSIVRAGEKIYFIVNVKYPENSTRKDLRIEYTIQENGKEIARQKVLRAVETQSSFAENITLPRESEAGMHTLNVLVTDYADLHGEVLTSFRVLSSGMERWEVYSLVSLLLLFAVVGLVLYDIRQRKKGSSDEDDQSQLPH